MAQFHWQPYKPIMLLPACLTDNASVPSAYFLSSHRFYTNLSQFHLTKVGFFSPELCLLNVSWQMQSGLLGLECNQWFVGFNNDRPSSSTVFGT